MSCWRNIGPFPVELCLLVPKTDVKILQDIIEHYLHAVNNVNESFYFDLSAMSLQLSILTDEKHRKRVIFDNLSSVHGSKVCSDLVEYFDSGFIQSDSIMEAMFDSTFKHKKRLEKYMTRIY